MCMIRSWPWVVLWYSRTICYRYPQPNRPFLYSQSQFQPAAHWMRGF
jgi:hypothetical protein